MKRGYFGVTHEGRVLTIKETTSTIEQVKKDFHMAVVDEPIPHLVEEDDLTFPHPSQWLFLVADSFEQASKDFHKIIAHKKSGT